MTMPLDEDAVRFIMESTWAEATKTLARQAREIAKTLPTEIDGRTALIAFAATIEMTNASRGGSPT